MSGKTTLFIVAFALMTLAGAATGQLGVGLFAGVAMGLVAVLGVPNA